MTVCRGRFTIETCKLWSHIANEYF